VSIVRIANAQGFWGDRGEAALEILLREPHLDFITMDYLAEVSLSLMATQRQRGAGSGYAEDFLSVVQSLIPYWSRGGRCRLITNAGGLDPRACAAACASLLDEAGCGGLRIGIVYGDDVLAQLKSQPTLGNYRHLDTGAPLSDVAPHLLTANAYLGADPIVAALADDAHLVITGRVADPSLTVGACRHFFNWPADDWDRIAGATIAGHLIECGTQVTGGIATDWLDVPDPAHIGFPIVEVHDDGSCVVTKCRDTGGRVSLRSVTEQLLYEIGDPAKYLSPDATVSFRDLRLNDEGQDRVSVSGATGGPPPATYKVSATGQKGYRAAGTLTIFGRDAVLKGQRAGEIILQRMREAGHHWQDAIVECLGSGACGGGIFEQEHHGLRETVLRIAMEAESRVTLERFSRELMPLVTSGPQGTTGYAEGRPRVHPVFQYWPCLIDRALVLPQFEILDNRHPAMAPMLAELPQLPAKTESTFTPIAWPRRVPAIRLSDLAFARSGDKGINANVGIAAFDAEAYDFLLNWLTVDRVAEYVSPLGITSVERYLLPNLNAFNFILKGALARTLRVDAQGKALGQVLLEMPIIE
jgi:hypothetical protein